MLFLISYLWTSLTLFFLFYSISSKFPILSNIDIIIVIVVIIIMMLLLLLIRSLSLSLSCCYYYYHWYHYHYHAVTITVTDIIIIIVIMLFPYIIIILIKGFFKSSFSSCCILFFILKLNWSSISLVFLIYLQWIAISVCRVSHIASTSYCISIHIFLCLCCKYCQK